LENGQTPSPGTTKDIGCGIKSAGMTGKGKGPRSKGARGKRKGPPNAAQVLERMDTDSDQKISKAEAKGPLAGDFDKIDANKDGFLNTEKLESMKPKRKESKSFLIPKKDRNIFDS